MSKEVKIQIIVKVEKNLGKGTVVERGEFHVL